jgi:hypothetical protein
VCVYVNGGVRGKERIDHIACVAVDS